MDLPTRDDSGRLPAYAWPGGYPIIYVMADGETMCPACANGENGAEPIFAETDCPDDRQWTVIGADIHWEGPPEICAHCGEAIESAYGDPAAGDSAGIMTNDEYALAWSEGWTLSDYDGRGVFEIQRYDDDPEGRFTDDETALAWVRASETEYARKAVARHDRDAEAIAQIRVAA